MLNLFTTIIEDHRIAAAMAAQQSVLIEFHRRVEEALGTTCRLLPHEGPLLEIERNLFSSLFLAAQSCLGVPEERLFFCGMINQCMRAWVTGCDNILDNEFKSVIPFDLPEGESHFKSVLTIMAAERVFSGLLLEEQEAGRITAENGKELSHMTLQVLMPSGIQEHEEELGADQTLSPEALLEQVHVPKTGLLFEAPIAVAEWLLGGDSEESRAVRAGLRSFGLGCQILDDLVDYGIDREAGRSNYLYSLLRERGPEASFAIDSPSWSAAAMAASVRSAEFFAESRLSLLEAGLPIGEPAWDALVAVVPTLLRVPVPYHPQVLESV